MRTEWISLRVPSGTRIGYVVIDVPGPLARHMHDFQVHVSASARVEESGGSDSADNVLCTRYSHEVGRGTETYREWCGGASMAPPREQWVSLAQRGFVVAAEIQVTIAVGW